MISRHHFSRVRDSPLSLPHCRLGIALAFSAYYHVQSRALSAAVITFVHYTSPSIGGHYAASGIYLPDYSFSRAVCLSDKISNISMLAFLIASCMIIIR
ncbi:MAG TPA: hypothetical protein PKK43_07220 [Spirochaetota bacterium]|nr:hypothetical protein [Spirochaetota bacterium]